MTDGVKVTRTSKASAMVYPIALALLLLLILIWVWPTPYAYDAKGMTRRDRVTGAIEMWDTRAGDWRPLRDDAH